MFDLFIEDGVTTAIRGGTTQERVNFAYVEVPGVKWGRHVDGEWDRDYQERSATFEYFIEKTLRPALERGANFCHDLQPGISPSL